MLAAANFHYIRDDFTAPYPSIFGLTPRQFENQLDALAKSATFFSASDIIDVINGKKVLPERAWVITYDDGLREQYDLAWSILQRKGIPGIFYINTGPIENQNIVTTHKIHLLRSKVAPDVLFKAVNESIVRHGIKAEMPTAEKANSVYKYDTGEAARLKYFLNFVLSPQDCETVIDDCFPLYGEDEEKISRDLYMTKDMLADLGKAGVLGCHGHAHLPLGLLPKHEAKADITDAIQKIKQWTGHDVPTFSYPYGSLDACAPSLADNFKGTNVKFAFTMERAINRTLDMPFYLSRFACNDVPGGSSFKGTANEFWAREAAAQWHRKAA